MPTTAPADPIVEEDRVCPECGSEHLVRDYARGELVCDSCGLVISESAIDEGPEWAAYSVEENDRLARTGAPRSYVAGASGLTTVIPLANKDARGNTILLSPRAEQHRRGRGPQDPEGTGEDRKLDVPVPRRDCGGGNLPRLPRARRAPAAEGDREDRGRERGDPPQPLPIHGGVHATAGPAARSCAENQRLGGTGRLNAATLEFASRANRRKGLIWGACVPRVEPNGCLETNG